MTSLAGRLGIVSGAASGIGRAIALSLAGRGVRLVLADRDAGGLASVKAEIRAGGGEAWGLPCDAGDPDYPDRLAATAEPHGDVAILVNNVGVIASGLPQDIPPAEWERVFNVNLFSLVRATHRFLPGMLARGAGHIVNTASFAGLFPYAYDRLPYAASKAAIIALSEGLALYLRPQGIGVTCLCPGPVRTNIGSGARSWTDGLPRRPPAFPFQTAESVGEAVAEAIAANRFFLPTDAGVREPMIARAEDPDAFLDRQIAWIAESDRAAGA